MLAAAEGGDLSAMQAGFTGAAFDTAANKATIGDLDPNSTTDDAAAAASNTDAGEAETPTPSAGGGGGGGGGDAATFTVTVDENTGAVSFDGSATGNITVAWDGSGVATFSRGGVVATDKADFAIAAKITLAEGQNLVIDGAEFDGMTVDGDGTVSVTGDFSESDLMQISVGATLIVETNLSFNPMSTTNLPAVVGFEVAAGNTLTISAASLFVADGDSESPARSFSGGGNVTISNNFSGSTDLSQVTVTGDVIVNVVDGVNISSNTTLSVVSEYDVSVSSPWASGGFTLTAEQASGDVLLKGEANTSITVAASAGDQTIHVDTAGRSYITPGAGADQVILLGAGSDVVMVEVAGAVVQQEESIVLSGTYEVGDKISLTIDGGAPYEYTVTANDLMSTYMGMSVSVAGDSQEAYANISMQMYYVIADRGGMSAGVSNGVLSVSAETPFTIAVATTNTTSAPVAQQEAVTLSGTYEVGDTVAVTIDGSRYEYTAAAGDFYSMGDGAGMPVAGNSGAALYHIASKLAALIDADSGVSASASSSTVTAVAATPGTGFEIASETINQAAVAQQDQVFLFGIYEAGDKVAVTINEATYEYTVIADDLTADGAGGGGALNLVTDSAAIIGHVAAKLAALVEGAYDYVTASASGTIITMEALTPGDGFTISSLATNGGSDDGQRVDNSNSVSNVTGADAQGVAHENTVSNFGADTQVATVTQVSAYAAAGTVSDSSPFAFDTITGFAVGTDWLYVPTSWVLTGSFDATATGVANLTVSCGAAAYETFAAVTPATGNTISFTYAGTTYTATLSNGTTALQHDIEVASSWGGCGPALGLNKVVASFNGSDLVLTSTDSYYTLTGGLLNGSTHATDHAASTAVTFGGSAAATASVIDKATALLTAMGTDQYNATFVVGSDTYVVEGDGVAGLGAADIMVKLAGIQVTEFAAISYLSNT